MIEDNGGNSGRPDLSRRSFLRNAALVLGGASLYLLNGWKSWLTVKNMLPFKSSASTRNSQPRTGDISVGAKVDAVTQTIDSSGGYVAVSKAGDPLDGFTVYVPPNTYSGSSSFKVSYAPITDQTFGADINPVSPMISIDNGGEYSDDLMYVRVPVNVPDGYFAMGFIYDEQSKQLEGMPLVAIDADSVTLATCHFCDMFISMIDKLLLPDTIDSNFLPGVDDWQFTNYGSFIAPKGHCDGQSVSAMWYYCTKPDGKDATLFERYDNNGDEPISPDFWQDDSLGYRFCSVVQAHGHPTVDFWLALAGKNWVHDATTNEWKFVDMPMVLGDEVTWNMFAYAMQVTHEPQLIGVWTEAGKGHEMVCYAIEPGQFCVADPNYPGITDRIIKYTNGKFQPYNSGDNKTVINAGGGTSYTKIIYFAKSTVFRWDQIAKMWMLFKSRQIGAGLFPSYVLYYQDTPGVFNPTGKAFSTTAKEINIYVYFGVTQGDRPVMADPEVYRDGKLLPRGSGGVIDLVPGDNKLGIYITGKVDSEDEYIDFQYINVKYEAETTTTPPATSEGYPIIQSFTGPTDASQLTKTDATVTFTVKINGGKPPYKEIWYGGLDPYFVGNNMETVKIPVKQLVYANDSWTFHVIVSDAKDDYAEWVDSDGSSKQEFTYTITSAGKVSTTPTFPYQSV